MIEALAENRSPATNPLSLVHTGDKIDFDFLSPVESTETTESTKSTVRFVDFHKIDRVEVDFVTSVWEALRYVVDGPGVRQ